VEYGSHLPHDHEEEWAMVVCARRQNCHPHCRCLQQSLPVSGTVSVSVSLGGDSSCDPCGGTGPCTGALGAGGTRALCVGKLVWTARNITI